MKSKVSITKYNWFTWVIAAILFLATAIILYCFSNEDLKNYSEYIAAIGVVFSVGLAALAYILTIKIQKTDETVEVLKAGFNEQKKENLKSFKIFYNEFQFSMIALNRQMQKENLSIKKQEIIKQVEDIHASVEKLSHSPVINSNAEFINYFVIILFHIKELKTILVSDWKINEILYTYRQLDETYIKLNSLISTVQIEYRKTLI